MTGATEDKLRKARQDLLNSVSHELNTPLTPVLIHLRHLQERAKVLDDDLQESFAVVSRNIERLVDRVQAMIEVAQLDSERFPVRMESVPLEPIIEESVDDYKGVAKAAGVRLERHAKTEAQVHADAVRLKEVLANLLDNAIRFTPPGGNVMVGVEEKNQIAQVTIQDTGPGFTEEERRQLFQPFSQLHASRDDYRHAGLGLFISKGIIDLHGGEIEAHSAGPGQGAAFSFTVHLAKTRLLPIRWEDESRREVEFNKRTKNLV